jgi:hypothetical protein
MNCVDFCLLFRPAPTRENFIIGGETPSKIYLLIRVTGL